MPYRAVCTISGTRQTCPLPCALRTSTRQKIGTRQTCPLPCSLRISTRRRSGTRQTSPFAVCQGTKHTTKTRHTAKVGSLSCAIATAHGKDSNFVVCHVGSAHGKACATSPFLSPAFFAVGQDLHTAKLCHVPDILYKANCLAPAVKRPQRRFNLEVMVHFFGIDALIIS